MNNDTNNCSGCSQKDHCGEAFAKLGKAKGPNVAWKAIGAFLMPILVFILSLATADKILRNQFEGKMLTVISFLTALGVTLLAALLIWLIRQPSSNKSKSND